MNHSQKFFGTAFIIAVGLFVFIGASLGEQVWDEDSQSCITPAQKSDYGPPPINYNTDQPRLLWDDMHDTDGDDLYNNYTSCAAIMDSLGLVAIQISAGQFNQSMLDSFDILVLIDAETAYTQDEITVVQNWINAGGKLLMIGEGGSAFNLASNNQMIQPYNIQFSGSSTEATNFEPHPVTLNLTRISGSFCTPLTVTTPAVALAWDASMFNAIAINESGVIVLAMFDSNMMDNTYIGNNSNRQCMINVFQYLMESSLGLTVTLTPHNPPIQIPAGGGTFSFEAMIENAADSAITFDAWTMVILPNGVPYGPLVRRNNLTIPPGATIMRALSQFVPMVAPHGTYTYMGYVGVYPDSIFDEDGFEFAKLAGDGSPNHNQGWAVHGWNDNETEITILNFQFSILSSNPNPFNPATVLRYHLQAAGNVKLAVYDIAGREVASLADGYLPAGFHQVTFEAGDLASGVYFASLQTTSEVKTVKLLLLK